ncbi:MAG: hypothetical protein AAF525_10440 [Pseudomonadota bacterium]
MKKITLLLCLMLTPAVFAGGHASPAHEMATIMSELNHFPTAAHKKTLEKVANKNSATADERTLAGIIARIAHTPTAEDKQTLQAMLESDETSASCRTIAAAILGMNHRVQATDLETLATVK